MIGLKVIDPVLSREFRQFEMALKRYIRSTDEETGSVMRKEARLFAVDLVHNTQPFGRNKNAHTSGKRAVVRDVAKVYANSGKLYSEIERASEVAARHMYGLMKNDRLPEAESLLRRVGGRFSGLKVRDFDNGTEHRSRRRNGRVPFGSKPTVAIPDPKDRREYSDDVGKRVGWAKASWAADMGKLGGFRGLPAWTRKAGAKGHIVDHTRGRKPVKGVTFVSRVSYISRVLRESSVRRALRFRARALLRKMGIVHRKGLRRL